MKITATRYHDFSCGHRVVGHEGKCALLHGHNYRAHFTLERDSQELDSVSRVLDFSVIKSVLCEWLEEHFDHRFLAWENDECMRVLTNIDVIMLRGEAHQMLFDSIVWVPFNPTAERIAEYLLKTVGPDLLRGHGCVLTKVVIEETRKCSASAEN